FPAAGNATSPLSVSLCLETGPDAAHPAAGRLRLAASSRTCLHPHRPGRPAPWRRLRQPLLPLRCPATTLRSTRRLPPLLQRLRQQGDFLLFSNASGQVAGSEYRGQGNNRTIHGLLWQRGESLDLGTLGGKNCLVTGLSASGQVIGASDTSEGQQHAFLWKDG